MTTLSIMIREKLRTKVRYPFASLERRSILVNKGVIGGWILNYWPLDGMLTSGIPSLIMRGMQEL